MRLVAAARRITGALLSTLECRLAVELMTDYLEGALRGRDLRRFERHLAGCVACAAYLDQMRTTLALAGRLRSTDLPDEVMDELVDLYRRVRAG